MKSKGFTLIELIITLGIIVILLSISSLSFKNTDYFKARLDLKKVKKDVEFTRNLALINRKEAKMYLRKNNYTIVCNDFIEKRDYSNLLELKNYKETRVLTFDKKGVPKKNTSGTIFFKIKDREYKLTIEPIIGRVNLYEET